MSDQSPSSAIWNRTIFYWMSGVIQLLSCQATWQGQF